MAECVLYGACVFDINETCAEACYAMYCDDDELPPDVEQ